MQHIIFLLEEPSAQDALEYLLPKLLGDGFERTHKVHFLVFEGKQDLEKRMVQRMRLWLQPNSQFIVLRDQDSGDCVKIKTELVKNCRAAGRPNAVVRIACRELESFFVGDWSAVARAFDKPSLSRLSGKAKYRNSDALMSPSKELLFHIEGYQKRDGARRISQHLDLGNNKSRSFFILINAIREVACVDGH